MVVDSELYYLKHLNASFSFEINSHTTATDWVAVGEAMEKGFGGGEIEFFP